jgi:hypothetical protein
MSRTKRPNLYVILALKRKYGQLRGQAEFDLFWDRESIRADLDHLAAVLRMFEPDVDLDAIRVIRPKVAVRGHWSRTALTILREANAPMRGRDLARRVMVVHGFDPNDFRVMVSIECSLQSVLRRLERRGLIVTTGKPRRWAITR